jgi:hypothetical protein
MQRRHFAIAAGVLYLLLGALTAFILARWVQAGVSEAVQFLEAAPQFLHSFIAVPILFVGSVLLAVVLLRGRTGRSLFAASCAVAVVGVVWNIGALLVWLVPVPFVWLSIRGQA